jgi:hypothetical protein
MKRSLKVVGIAVALVGVAVAIAVRKHNAPAPSNAASDLQRARADLALAQSQDARKYPLTEIPDPTPKLIAAPRNLNVADTARVSPIAREAERIERQMTELPRTRVMGTSAPIPTMPSVLAVPQPTGPTGIAGASERDTFAGEQTRRELGPRRNGRGEFVPPDSVIPIFGGLGAIIRGGSVDGDHCDPRGIHPVHAPTYAGDPAGPGTGSVRPGGVPVSTGPITPSRVGGMRPPT